jgi:hypothetical protein
VYSTFFVFRVAAGDADPRIVTLAFPSVETIMTAHFPLVAEFFTDCVSCLVAFAGQTQHQPTSLAALSFLEFCARELASDHLRLPAVAIPATPHPDRKSAPAPLKTTGAWAGEGVPCAVQGGVL